MGLVPILLELSDPVDVSRIIPKLIHGIDLCTCPRVSRLIIDILLVIVKKTPVGSGIVNVLLRRFSSNPEILKTLQRAAQPEDSLYFYELIQESPKVKRSPKDEELNELAEIYQTIPDGGDDYVCAIKKRLSTFDLMPFDDSLWSFSKPDLSLETQTNKDIFWLNRRWLEERDFAPNKLTLRDFSVQSKKLNNLNLLLTDRIKSLKSTSPILRCIEDLHTKKRSVRCTELKNLFAIATEEPCELNFQGISLLSLISPQLESVSRHLLTEMTARLLYRQGKFDLAIETAKRALGNFPEGSVPEELRAVLLARTGEWVAASKSERPSKILITYFERVRGLCEDRYAFSSQSLSQIHLKIARFVDEQYQHIRDSEDFKLREKLLGDSRIALAASRASSSQHLAPTLRRQVEISMATLRSQSDLDMQEYAERLRSLNSFLAKAVENFLSALSIGGLSESEQMAGISRLCALWFTNSDFSTISDRINNYISPSDKKTKSLPLHLFLPLIYQLAARASFDRSAPNPSPFQRTLLRLLVQLTLNFPFDCIYQLIALRSGGNESEHSPAPKAPTKRRKLVNEECRESIDLTTEPESQDKSSESELRAAAASIIIDQSRKVPELNTHISAIELLVEAYCELALTAPLKDSVSTSSARRIEFEPQLKISKLLYPLPTDSPLKQIPIATVSSNDSNINYHDYKNYHCMNKPKMLFSGFINGYRLFGGINWPKQVDVVSDSGARAAQLVKGNDDVRQDAVMEQVFLRVNKLLASDPETRKRALAIRTYRVIPLKPLVGILEWVDNSIPLANYLSDAHERLNPGDLKPKECRDLMRAEFERPGSTVESKSSLLSHKIKPRFRPVLRHFFFEHFSLNQHQWWQAKQAYTSSLATSSIVGWIVGLGDRHGMNILLDKQTGHVVHIDLNMIFEAGRTLRIPERVPFRLTPDCVDALGPNQIGLEGPFKQHAIETLRVLRKESPLLLMIMDVFKYDPLQKWAGMAKAFKINNNKPLAGANLTVNTSSADSVISKEADRTLLRIREKLEGREEGVVLSEAGHVSFLIQTATDPELLCQMYFGWQPYF